MTIKHTIRREATKPAAHRMRESQSGRPVVEIPRPEQLFIRSPLDEDVRREAPVRRVEGFFKGGGAAMLQMLFDLTHNEPVELQFGDKIIRMELLDAPIDTPEQPPDTTPGPIRPPGAGNGR
jgi:hypothetical protein